MTQLPIGVIDIIHDYVQPNINDILLSQPVRILNNRADYWNHTRIIMTRVTNTRIANTSYSEYRSKPFLRGIFRYYVRV